MRNWKRNFRIWISQKWFEISTPNFHQLLTLLGTRFVLNMKALAALNLNSPPKTSKPSNGHSRPNFWATPSKFGENSFFPKLQICWNFGSATSKGLEISKISVECTVHILRRPCISVVHPLFSAPRVAPALEKINLNISLYLMTLGSPFYQIHLILVENLLSLYFVEVELNWETQQWSRLSILNIWKIKLLILKRTYNQIKSKIA